MQSLSRLDFAPISESQEVHGISRPSLSYWQDAWIRLKANKRALISLCIVICLLLFTIVGPLIWRVSPAVQDLDQVSQPPGSSRDALIVDDYTPWFGEENSAENSLSVFGEPTTQVVRLQWAALPGAIGHRVYRNLFPLGVERAYGIPIAEFFDNNTLFFEDRLDLKPQNYYYSVVALGQFGELREEYELIEVDVHRVTTIAEALGQGLIQQTDNYQIGDAIDMAWHPLGTDYLGRDMLARLMAGARVSLFIGIGAPFLFVLFGVVYGSIAGFMGGKVDQVMMRFADFVVA
jgi:oligopeptide transport system permease protein